MATLLSTSKLVVQEYVMSESEKKQRNVYHVELSMKSSLIYKTHMTQSVSLLCCVRSGVSSHPATNFQAWTQGTGHMTQSGKLCITSWS